ncbi:hypothetical protein GC175_22120 [bacterium]|nr:hypothetical protein [bacterium]
MLLLCRVTALFVLLCVMLTFSADIQAAPLAQDASVRLSCRIEPVTLPLNGEATIVIEIANVQNLYGYELDLIYDVNLIQMQDADPNQSGTNLELADKFLSPDFVVKNFAESGSLSIALTQLAPNQAKSGSGELAHISFVGTATGFANFAFGKVVFSDNNGMAIPLMAEDCLAEIGSSGAPTPTATSTPTPLPSLTPTLSPTPVHTASSTPDETQVTGVNETQPTATFTAVPPTALPTETPVAPLTATFTPVTQTTSPTGTSPTATFTPIPPTATETATPFVPPTATVLVISTPTPAIESPIGGDPRTQEQQPTPVPTEPLPVPTATPSVVEGDALVDGGASPPVTSLLPTAPTVSDPAAGSSPALAPSATPTLAPEALSPPQLAQESPDQSMLETAVVPTESVPGEAPVAAATVAQSPTPTATPLVIARVIDSVEARPPRAKIVVDQPQPVRPLIQGAVLRIGAWITLLCALLLVVFAWRLRKS